MQSPSSITSPSTFGRHFSGPRERAMESGTAELADGELIAILLGTGSQKYPVNVLAEHLLTMVGGLPSLSDLGASGLAELPGVGLAKSLRVAAAFELGRRVERARSGVRAKLQTAVDVAEVMGPKLARLEHEEMWLLALDGRNGLRAARRVAQGGLHGCSVRACDILRVGLREAASAFVLVHNHPSLDPTPSPEDISMTRAVTEASNVVGMPLLDHVILAGKTHASMMELGLIL